MASLPYRLTSDFLQARVFFHLKKRGLPGVIDTQNQVRD